jgi:hypothetical protein
MPPTIHIYAEVAQGTVIHGINKFFSTKMAFAICIVNCPGGDFLERMSGVTRVVDGVWPLDAFRMCSKTAACAVVAEAIIFIASCASIYIIVI